MDKHIPSINRLISSSFISKSLLSLTDFRRDRRHSKESILNNWLSCIFLVYRFLFYLDLKIMRNVSKYAEEFHSLVQPVLIFIGRSQPANYKN